MKQGSGACPKKINLPCRYQQIPTGRYILQILLWVGKFPKNVPTQWKYSFDKFLSYKNDSGEMLGHKIAVWGQGKEGKNEDGPGTTLALALEYTELLLVEFE